MSVSINACTCYILCQVKMYPPCQKNNRQIIFTFFPVFFFFTVLKLISKQLPNFLWVWNWFFHVNYLRLLKKLYSYKKNKETTYHLLIHDSPSEMTKTKTKQSNSTITITTDWIEHSKYKDWYHFTDLDASICRNDSLVIVLACLYLYTCIYIIKSSTSWSLFFFLFWCSRRQYKLIIFSQIFFLYKESFSYQYKWQSILQ